MLNFVSFLSKVIVDVENSYQILIYNNCLLGDSGYPSTVTFKTTVVEFRTVY